MTPSAEFIAWARLLVLLAAELTLVMAIAEGLARLTRLALWRRIIWQGCVVGMLILIAVETSGAGRTLADWVRHKRVPVSRSVPGLPEQFHRGVPDTWRGM